MSYIYKCGYSYLNYHILFLFYIQLNILTMCMYYYYYLLHIIINYFIHICASLFLTQNIVVAVNLRE